MIEDIIDELQSLNTRIAVRLAEINRQLGRPARCNAGYQMPATDIDRKEQGEDL